MKTQKDVKNDNINLQSGSLTDLPVADEQADQTRGGAGPHVKVYNGQTFAPDREELDDIIVGAGPGAGPHVK